MVWMPDILIEYRGMSIVTALFFTGVFFVLWIGWLYISDRFNRIERRIDNAKEQIKLAEKCLNELNTDIAVIKSTLQRIDKSLEKLINRIEQTKTEYKGR